MTGYNPEEVTASIRSLISAYEELISVVGDRLQNDIVNGMADKWACPKAQEFFNDAFKPDVDTLISNINVVFASVVGAMNDAAQAWAADNGDVFSPVGFTQISKTMDTSCILENIAGIRGIDLEQASQVAAKLPVLASEAQNAVSKASNSVDTCGFVGGSQSAELKGSLEKIRANITETTENLTANIKLVFDNTIETYGNTAGRISQAFAGE